MRGKIRICVATVAFGLGINKSDIVGVVHMYLSASPEHYLQEIGRAGRDGRQAHAIALVLADEVLVRHSLAHSDLISRSQVQSFLCALSSAIGEASAMLQGADPCAVNVGLLTSESVLACDCKSETIETIVSLLEQRDEPLLVVEGWYYDRAFVTPRRALDKITDREPVIRAMLQCASHRSTTDDSTGDDETTTTVATVRKLLPSAYSFSVAQCANCLGSGAEPRHVFAALRRLKDNGDIDYNLDLSDGGRGLNLRVLPAGLSRFQVQNRVSIDDLATELSNRLNITVGACCTKVLSLDLILRQVAESSAATVENGKSTRLCLFQQLMKDYFAADSSADLSAEHSSSFAMLEQQQLQADVRSLMSYLCGLEDSLGTKSDLLLRDCPDYTSLTLAKFLHGIQASARYQPSLMYQHALFGRLQGSRFEAVHEAIDKIIRS